MNSIISCILVTSILVCLFSFTNSTCSDLKDCFSKVRSGKLAGYTIKTFSNKGYRECFNECFQHANVCLSFNYNKFTGLCELNSRIPYSMTLIDVTTFVNSLIPSVQPNDPCSLHPCSPSQMCAALSSGATTCVNECGIDLPLVEKERMLNDVDDTELYFKAGETFPYVCTSEYTKGNNSRICLAGGLWEHDRPLCARRMCTFEEPCPYLEDASDALHFTKWSHSTPSDNTGCNTDHTTGNGYYYYLEASSPYNGSVFKMVTSKPFPAGEQICVGLWYHMYGNAMGNLFVDINDQSGTLKTQMLVAYGPQGLEWNYWSTVVNALTFDALIAITGVRGTGLRSDICFDDVLVDLC